MNGRTARLMRRLEARTGVSRRKWKRLWYATPRRDRHGVRKALSRRPPR